MATTRGTVKRTPLQDFRHVRRSGLIAIGLADDDELAWVQLSEGSEDIVLVTSDGRATQGVRLMRLNEGDGVVSMAFVGDGEPEED